MTGSSDSKDRRYGSELAGAKSPVRASLGARPDNLEALERAASALAKKAEEPPPPVRPVPELKPVGAVVITPVPVEPGPSAADLGLTEPEHQLRLTKKAEVDKTELEQARTSAMPSSIPPPPPMRPVPELKPVDDGSPPKSPEPSIEIPVQMGDSVMMAAAAKAELPVRRDPQISLITTGDMPVASVPMPVQVQPQLTAPPLPPAPPAPSTPPKEPRDYRGLSERKNEVQEVPIVGPPTISGFTPDGKLKRWVKNFVAEAKAELKRRWATYLIVGIPAMVLMAWGLALVLIHLNSDGSVDALMRGPVPAVPATVTVAVPDASTEAAADTEPTTVVEAVTPVLPPPPLPAGPTGAEPGLTGARGAMVTMPAHLAFPISCLTGWGTRRTDGVMFHCGTGERRGPNVCACDAVGTAR